MNKPRFSRWLIAMQVVGVIGFGGVGVLQGTSLIRSGIQFSESTSAIKASKDEMIQRMLNAGVIDEAKAREAIIHHATQQGINPSIGSRTEPADVRSVFDNNSAGSELASMGTQLITAGVMVLLGTVLLVINMGVVQWYSYAGASKKSGVLRGEVMAM